MTAVDLMKLELTRLHKSYDKFLDELTPEQLHRVPAGHAKANTIAWGVWHYVRTEDNVVRYILQNRRPIVWAEGGYAEKLGLPPVAQGTGMSTEESQALRIKDLGLFREYVGKVWASTDEYLGQGRSRHARRHGDDQAARRHAGHPRAGPGVREPRLHARRRDRAGAHAGRLADRGRRERQKGVVASAADDLTEHVEVTERGDEREVESAFDGRDVPPEGQPGRSRGWSPLRHR